MSANEGTPVQLPQAIADSIIAHAREGKPEEICGILRGRGSEAFELMRGQNMAEDKIDNYTVDPRTLLLQFEFEDAGDEMMGIYHSHPISVAYPSATDAWNAHYPDSIYFICSLEFDDEPDEFLLAGFFLCEVVTEGFGDRSVVIEDEVVDVSGAAGCFDFAVVFGDVFEGAIAAGHAAIIAGFPPLLSAFSGR